MGRYSSGVQQGDLSSHRQCEKGERERVETKLADDRCQSVSKLGVSWKGSKKKGVPNDDGQGNARTPLSLFERGSDSGHFSTVKN